MKECERENRYHVESKRESGKDGLMTMLTTYVRKETVSQQNGKIEKVLKHEGEKTKAGKDQTFSSVEEWFHYDGD